MSKKLTLEQSRRNRSTVELYEGPLLAAAAFMDRPRDQFLSRAGLPEKQNRRVAGSHGLHEVQNMAESRTLPHNSFEVHLAANFVFQIQFFLREFVLEIGDFTVRQRVLHTDRDLLRDLSQKGRRLPIKSILFPARQGQHAQ